MIFEFCTSHCFNAIKLRKVMFWVNFYRRHLHPLNCNCIRQRKYKFCCLNYSCFFEWGSMIFLSNYFRLRRLNCSIQNWWRFNLSSSFFPWCQVSRRWDLRWSFDGNSTYFNSRCSFLLSWRHLSCHFSFKICSRSHLCCNLVLDGSNKFFFSCRVLWCHLCSHSNYFFNHCWLLLE